MTRSTPVGVSCTVLLLIAMANGAPAQTSVDTVGRIDSVFAEYDRTVRDLVNFLVWIGEPAQAKRLFDFCKEMDTGTIVAEPPAGALDMIEKLCDEYRINVAFHNHARYECP